MLPFQYVLALLFVSHRFCDGNDVIYKNLSLDDNNTSKIEATNTLGKNASEKEENNFSGSLSSATYASNFDTFRSNDANVTGHNNDTIAGIVAFGDFIIDTENDAEHDTEYHTIQNDVAGRKDITVVNNFGGFSDDAKNGVVEDDSNYIVAEESAGFKAGADLDVNIYQRRDCRQFDYLARQVSQSSNNWNSWINQNIPNGKNAVAVTVVPTIPP